VFSASACTYVTGPFIVGTNAMGSFNQPGVTCPGGQFAVGIIPTWSAWAFASACQPVSRRLTSSTVVTEWFSSPAGAGTGCQGNNLATMTLCGTP
jgi:hypothetical protein